jgi:hypothetical protein
LEKTTPLKNEAVEKNEAKRKLANVVSARAPLSPPEGAAATKKKKEQLLLSKRLFPQNIIGSENFAPSFNKRGREVVGPRRQRASAALASRGRGDDAANLEKKKEQLLLLKDFSICFP